MPQTATVPMYAPDGTLGEIPYDQMHAALEAGGKLGVHLKAPDGTEGVIPAHHVQEAVKAGGKVVPYDLSKAPSGEQHKGIWDTIADDVKSIFSMPLEPSEPQSYTGPDYSMGGAGNVEQGRAVRAQDILRKQEGHNLPYRAAAGAVDALVPSQPVTGMEQGAREGNVDAVIGHMLAGQALAATPLATEGLMRVSPKVVSMTEGAKAAAGTALRTETGSLKPGVRAVASIGKLVGAPEMADWLIPDRPGAATMMERRAVPINKSPAYDPVAYKAGAMERMSPSGESVPINQSPAYDLEAYKAGAAKRSTKSTIVTPEAGAPTVGVSEGRPATWTNERVIQMAGKGNRDAIAQAVRRGFMLPENTRYIMGDMDYPHAVSNPKSVTKFGPTGEVITQGQPMEPTFAYRSRDIGEQGIPADPRSHAHATTDLEDLKRLAPGRESITGKPQEFVKVDLTKKEEGVDYVLMHRPGEAPWVRFLRPVPESEILRHPRE